MPRNLKIIAYSANAKDYIITNKQSNWWSASTI